MGIWIINHKHSEKFSSLFMQARTKRDLYDTLRTIKVHVDGSREKIPRANNFTESSRVLREMSREKAESLQIVTKFVGLRCEKLQC